VKNSSDATVIALVSLAHGMSHFFQIIVAPLFPLIKEELGVSYAALGFSLTLFYALSAICQPAAGFVVDRFGARGVLLGGIGLMAAGVLLVGISTSYPVLVAGMALAGIGNGVFHPCDFSIINTRVGARRLGYAYSAHGIAGALGYAAAPAFSGGLGALFGWHAALLAAGCAGIGMLVLLFAFRASLDVKIELPHASKRPFAEEVRVLLTPAVVLCFAYFTIYTAGLVGLQSFSVTAMMVQYGVSAALASTALTAYMLGSAAGILAGGFIATRASRHDLVAVTGLAVGSAAILLVALNQVPGAALPAMLALAGLAVGATSPSRDLIVRSSTPPGATGRVYGFVYSGLDFGSLITPVLYGWLIDHNLPQGVFLLVCTFTALAIVTVLQLPGRTRPAAAT
jgi:MFS family permease